MTKFEQHTPFADPLREVSKESDAIKSLKSFPNKLIRERPLFGDTPEKVQQSIDIFTRGKRLFENLKTQYGMRIPNMDFVVGRNKDGEKVMFTAVDKIKGRRIDQMEVFPRLAQEKLDEFYSALLGHYSDVYRKGGDYVWDFRGDQAMWGKKSGQSSNDVWFIDVDPDYGEYQKDHEPAKNERLFTLVARIGREIVDSEKKFVAPTPLALSRAALEEFIRPIPRTAPHYEILAETKELLDSSPKPTGAQESDE